jgi:hypothetical protein
MAKPLSQTVGLAVPFALDEHGRVAHPLTASKRRRYRCLECNEQVFPRHRKGFLPHFYHAPGSKSVCGGESVVHRAAKLALQHVVRQSLEEAHAIRWFRDCPGYEEECRDRYRFPCEHSLPAWDGVALEVTHGDHRFDVAVVHRSRVVFGFEVYHRHAVPPEKARALDVPWLELKAEDVLEGKPLVDLRSPRADGLCPRCQESERLERQRQREDKERRKIDGLFDTYAKRVQERWDAITQARSGAEIAFDDAVRFARKYLLDQKISRERVRGLSLIVTNCQEGCGKRMIFIYTKEVSKLPREGPFEDLILVDSFRGRLTAEHICPHCGTVYPHESVACFQRSSTTIVLFSSWL